MGPKKLAKENEIEDVKPTRVLRTRLPQTVDTNVEVEIIEKKIKRKKVAKIDENVKTDKPKEIKATKSNGDVKLKAPPKVKAAKGHKLPDPIKPGEVFVDSAKNSWRVGRSLGSGGFGEVYSATDDVNDNKVDGYKYVMKVEYSTGPLFVEQHFYIRCAKPEHLATWKKEKKLKVLGLPTFYAMKGQQEHNGNSYRFIIISKFGSDLQHLLEEYKKFSVKNTLTIGCSLLDTLEYIHHCGYAHADLKPANVLLGVDSSQAVVNIVDFGLATKYKDTENNHKDHIVDKKAAHNGTLIYTSCVAHRGATTTSRICDIEILGYNLLHLVTGSLPWQPFEKTPDKVLQMKEELLKDPKTFFSTHYNVPVPDVFVDLFKYISSSNFDTVPDYDKLKLIFTKALQKAGQKFDGKLNFSDTEANGETRITKKIAPAKKKAVKKAAADLEIENSEEQIEENSEIDLNKGDLRHVNTKRPKLKEIEEKKDVTEKTKKKNVKEEKVSVPTQAMLDVMNNKNIKAMAKSKKKKAEDLPVEVSDEEKLSKPDVKRNIKVIEKGNEISEEQKATKTVTKKAKKEVDASDDQSGLADKKPKNIVKVYPSKKKNANKEPQTNAEIPTPAMLEYINKKNKLENGAKAKGVIDLEEDFNSEDEEPKEKKIKNGKDTIPTRGVKQISHDLSYISERGEEVKHAMNETFNVEQPPIPLHKRKPVAKGKA